MIDALGCRNLQHLHISLHSLLGLVMLVLSRIIEVGPRYEGHGNDEELFIGDELARGQKHLTWFTYTGKQELRGNQRLPLVGFAVVMI